MEKTYNGFLEIDEYSCLKCGYSYLVEDIEADFKVGDNVFVRYYITDKEVTKEEVNEVLVLKVIGGNIEGLRFILDAYSEFTIEEIEETLIIGGHDLFGELQNYENKYLTLVIEKVSNNIK